MSRSASERGRLGVSIGGCSFSGEWAADARLLRCTRQAGQLSRPSPPKSRNTRSTARAASCCFRMSRGTWYSCLDVHANTFRILLSSNAAACMNTASSAAARSVQCPASWAPAAGRAVVTMSCDSLSARSHARHAGTGDHRSNSMPCDGTASPAGSNSQHLPTWLRVAAVCWSTSGLVEVDTIGPLAARILDHNACCLTLPRWAKHQDSVLGMGQDPFPTVSSQVDVSAFVEHVFPQNRAEANSCRNPSDPGEPPSIQKFLKAIYNRVTDSRKTSETGHRSNRQQKKKCRPQHQCK